MLTMSKLRFESNQSVHDPDRHPTSPLRPYQPTPNPECRDGPTPPMQANAAKYQSPHDIRITLPPYASHLGSCNPATI